MDRESANRVNAAEILGYIAAIVADEAAHGVERIGERVALRIAEELGGQQCYFPKDRPRRDQRIYELFTGSNSADLARRFHLSDSAIRRIIAKERARRRLTQCSFFDM